VDHVASIVADIHLTKPEALAVIAATLDAPVQGARTATAFVGLPQGGWVDVEVPKFGEAPPLTLDVHDPRGQAEARASAQSLLDLLNDIAGWPVHHLHD